MPSTIGDFVYFKLVYDYLEDKISEFGMDLMGRAMSWASGVALVLVTLWIMIQGYRIISGQSRESMMAMVTQMTRVVIIVTAATTMSIFGSSLHRFLTVDLAKEINQVLTGSDDTPADLIDRNLAWTQATLGVIDAVQVPFSDAETREKKERALLLAGFGTASAPMAAGAMLLLYQFAIALFIGLGPLFILCLIFDQTRDLFRKWLFYGIGTLFSMATLAAISAIVLQLMIRIAEAVWGARIINHFLAGDAEGISSQALQQGGIGLLLTVLIVSVPPMAAMFFQGTLGNFLTYSAFASPRGNGPGPQGQPPGSYASPPAALRANESVPVRIGAMGGPPIALPDTVKGARV
ncbi:type IV secretion system protein [Frateuria soli]|uniref:type IV secretion system protein n=1 Tax=Frateuria soli TaxID=1542730 RepID=UPI001E2C010C|nr:type IV secretion system protein [Frateuria soli]UGB39389.1 type IV secretion system protein [Frateuria soli]